MASMTRPSVPNWERLQRELRVDAHAAVDLALGRENQVAASEGLGMLQAWLAAS
jgi:hypothetical protein